MNSESHLNVELVTLTQKMVVTNKMVCHRNPLFLPCCILFTAHCSVKIERSEWAHFLPLLIQDIGVRIFLHPESTEELQQSHVWLAHTSFLNFSPLPVGAACTYGQSGSREWCINYIDSGQRQGIVGGEKNVRALLDESEVWEHCPRWGKSIIELCPITWEEMSKLLSWGSYNKEVSIHTSLIQIMLQNGTV